MPGEYTFYSGSHLFSPISEWLGLPLDQINFVACQFIAVLFSYIYSIYFAPKRSSEFLRLIVPPCLGLFMGLFAHGWAIKHLLAEAIVSYLLLIFAPRDFAHRLVFVFTMGYLSFIHYTKTFYADTYMLDVTGPMMVMTQKISSLAFSIHDGNINTDSKSLTMIQRRELVREIPTFLEFMSYLFNFQSIMCGPLMFYHDYISFIKGAHVDSMLKEQAALLNGNNNLSSRFANVDVEKINPWVVVATLCLVLGIMSTAVPLEASVAVENENWSFLYRLAYVLVSLQLIRCRYYFAWILAEAACNASGFGFSGLDEITGEPQWDLVSNIHVLKFELADSFKTSLEAWNIGTMSWLRRVAYERSPVKYRTVFTYTLSAWWHGFYPGYYITFVTGGFFTEAARQVRRRIRPLFLDSVNKKKFYDALTFTSTRLAIAYVAAPFMLLQFAPAFKICRLFYFYMHFAAFLGIFLLPRLLPSPKEPKAKKDIE